MISLTDSRRLHDMTSVAPESLESPEESESLESPEEPESLESPESLGPAKEWREGLTPRRTYNTQRHHCPQLGIEQAAYVYTSQE